MNSLHRIHLEADEDLMAIPRATVMTTAGTKGPIVHTGIAIALGIGQGEDRGIAQDTVHDRIHADGAPTIMTTSPGRPHRVGTMRLRRG